VSASSPRFIAFGLNSNVFALSFSPEGNRLWVATKDSTKRLDISSGAESKGMSLQPCNESLMGGISFGLGCARIAVSGKGWVRVYDNSRQKEMAVFENTFVPCLAFSQSGGEMFFGGNEGDGNVRLLKVGDKKQVQSFTGLRDRTVALRISVDGRFLAASSGPAQPKQRPSQNKINVWETSSGRLIHEFTADNWQYGLAFSSDGRRLASGGGGSDDDWMGHNNGADNSVRIWDLRSGDELQRLSGHTAAVRAVDFTPDGKFLISGGADSTVRVWGIEQN
jgi:WD40 repeat protein